MLGGCLVGSSWVLLWASTNPQAEVFAFPCLLAGLESFLAGQRARGDGKSRMRVRRSELLFLRAAAWMGVGVSLRYEMWYAGALLGLFLAGRLAVFLFLAGAAAFPAFFARRFLAVGFAAFFSPTSAARIPKILIAAAA